MEHKQESSEEAADKVVTAFDSSSEDISKLGNHTDKEHLTPQQELGNS